MTIAATEPNIPAANRIDFIEKSVGEGLAAAAALTLAADCLIVLYGVFTRYALGDQPFWTEEAARLLMVWLTSLGGAYAFLKGMHIRIDIAIKALPRQLRVHVELVGLLLSVVFAAIAGYHSISLIELRGSDITPGLDLPYSLFIWPITLSLFAMTAVGVLLAARHTMREVLISVAVVVALCILFGMAAPYLENAGRGLTVLWILAGVFVFLLVAGVPVAFSLGIATLVFFEMRPQLPMPILPQRMVGGVDSFVLLAVPLFLVAGVFMETGSISRKLIDLARALVGHIRGGLGMVTVTAEIFFSGVSGSTTADVAAVGAAMNPAMQRAGYKSEDAAAIVSAACAMGILIPPSLHMVLLGSIVSVSIADLFWGGILPSLVLAASLYGMVYFKARRAAWPAEMSRASSADLLRAMRGAILPLLLPVIIFAGIKTGLATVTESAVLAVAYAFLLSLLVYREFTVRNIYKALVDAAASTGLTLWLVMTATIFGWIMTSEQIPNLLGQAIASISHSAEFFLVLVILVMVVFSGLLEGLPALLIFAPIFYPIAMQFGINPVHFGLILIASLGIGFFLPPIGLGLFLAAGIAKADLLATSRAFLPYMLVLIITLALVSFFPQLSLFLPNLFR